MSFILWSVLMRRLAILLVLLATAAWSTSSGVTRVAAFSGSSSAALSSYLQGAVSRGEIPGVVVAAVGPGRLLYHEAYGTMNAARKVPMAKDAIFNIASMTKPVTSIAIMMLVEEGKLRLDDDVSKFLPKFANPSVITNFNPADASYTTRPATRGITIRHLLTHTSGIGYGFSSPTIAAIQQKTMQNELDLPLLFEPGEGWAYGASTRVLGQVVEAISGLRLDAFLESRIFRPLGMQDTAYVVPKEKYARVVTSHARTEGGWSERPVPASLPANVAGDGGLYSTAADYAQFVRMLLNDGRAGSTRLLQERTVRTIFESHTGPVVVQTQQTTNPALSRPFPLGAGEDPWGLGFQLSRPKARRPDMRNPGSGTWAGIFNTHFWIDRQEQLGVIVMMQLLPFYDERAMRVMENVERVAYTD
jgi:CubicO group peptidase (beta-lactamase class C family)